MQSKHSRLSDGTQVRIRTRDAGGQTVYPELEKYENQAGVVLSSKAVVAYFIQPVTIMKRPQTDLPATLYMYTVKLEGDVTLNDLIEYCLEEI